METFTIQMTLDLTLGVGTYFTEAGLHRGFYFEN